MFIHRMENFLPRSSDLIEAYGFRVLDMILSCVKFIIRWGGCWEQVYDRAQVFVGSATNNRIFLGTLERWSRNTLTLPASASVSGLQLDILVRPQITQGIVT